ncbi:hypothetical protein JCGZ_13987 [Jatropha curcas]|uniref:H15 domain-containing protein n=1 Tax=Jatropha curcas TaxID=180498 RepID=A0A067JWA2_JATCU|nr:histone H1 [Jatropha curcas]KDP28216.1 hypothetical protein JCGZ_13987 [Jatropha curcas]
MAKGTVATATKKKDNKKTTNSPPVLHHPPYFEMISEAILALKERNGSSQPAIAKLIEEKYQTVLPSNFKKLLSVQLKKFVKSERLVRIKHSYKISSTEKLKLAIKETSTTQKSKSDAKKKPSLAPKEKNAKKINIPEKGSKTKRLGQVKTPEVLKKPKKDGKTEKMKRLSQVKTPEVLKKKQNPKARR